MAQKCGDGRGVGTRLPEGPPRPRLRPQCVEAVLASVPAVPAVPHPSFKVDVSGFTAEDALRRHTGACGGPPEVEVIQTGEDGLFAAIGTVRVRSSSLELFKRLTDPEENRRIFSDNVASVNYRHLIVDDKAAGTRLFEVSKTGRWHLAGLPFNFESTVLALEDWRTLEIRFRQKKAGAMQHMSGFWRVAPINQEESLVMFYNEAIPSFPVPRIFRQLAGRVVREMAASLLEDLRTASLKWPTSEPESRD